MQLNSFQVSSQPHSGSQIHVSSLSQLNLTSIWLLIFASRLHPGNTSPPSRSTKLHLNSIQASSQTHTGFKMSPNTRLKMCISPQSRSHLNPTQALRFTFLLCLSWILPQSGSWYLHLTYIQVTSRLHPGPPNSILIPSKHHLNPIQVTRYVSHLYPGHFSTGGLYLSSILVPYHPIHVSRCAAQLNPSPISTPSRSRDLCFPSTQAPIFTFLLCLSWMLFQSGSWYFHLAYIQVTSHVHRGPPNCIISNAYMFQDVCLTSTQALCNLRNVTQLHPSPISPHPRLKMCISTQSRSHLNPIQVSRFVSTLHPGCQIHVSSLSQLNLTSIWVLIFTFHLHPGYISPPSRSTKLHLSSIQASSQTHTGFKMCVSPPSMSFLNWIQVPRFCLNYFNVLSHLHPGP